MLRRLNNNDGSLTHAALWLALTHHLKYMLDLDDAERRNNRKAGSKMKMLR